jgi:rRNA maturation endonuclease Nob1
LSGWLVWLARGRSLELACALALGYAASILAKDLADVPVVALAQHVEDEAALLGEPNLFSGGVYLLNVEIASTVFFYGDVLASLLAVTLVGLVTLVVVRRRDRELTACPFCASRIPHESRHCAYCGSSVVPSEP